MNLNTLITYLTHWEPPLGPFRTLESLQKEQEQVVQELGAGCALEVLDTVMKGVEEQPDLVFGADDFLCLYYKAYPTAMRSALVKQTPIYQHSIYFVELLNLLPEGATLVENFSLEEVLQQSIPWQIAFLGVLARLRRLEDQLFLVEILEKTKEEEVLKEGNLLLSYFQE